MLRSLNKFLRLGRYTGGLRMSAPVAAVFLLALTGALWIRSDAATFASSHEAETGLLAGQAVRCTGSGASGSTFVRFGSTACSANTAKYTNPVLPAAADPGVFKWDGRYYMVYTTGDPWFPIYVSDDLVNWQPTGKNVFNGPGTHPWGNINFWAPELHRVGNRFAVYYSASDGANLRVGVAFADSILGPYADLGQPLIKDSFGVIDVNFFRDEDGRQYLYWKEDGGETRIFGQEVDQSGTALLGSRRTVLQKGLDWEGDKGIEGSWLTKKNGMYYMFYSGELYSTPLYSVGVARAASPLAAFSKKGGPILETGNRFKGPGHNSVTQAGANDYMVYHAYDYSEVIRSRKVLVDKITWANGWPSVANGTPTETPQPYPQ